MFDDHASVADGLANRLLVNLQSAEGDVRTVVAVEERNPAGGFEAGWAIGRMDESGKAWCADSGQPAKQ